MATPVVDRLAERDEELARLGELVASAQAGHGRLALIDGPAGIGKTTLLDAACATASDAGLDVVIARASELTQDVPYGIVRQLFRSRDALRGMAAHAAPVFDDAATGKPASADRSAAVLHGLYWLAVGAAERRPLLIAVDDAHWADAPSLGFLHYLALRLDDLPIAVAIACREEIDRDLLRRLAVAPVADILRPRPLSRRATAELVRSRLGAEGDPEFCDACHAAAGGIPFLLGELLSALAAHGVAPTGDRASRIAGLAPRAVSRQVLVRMAALEPAATRLARAIAVLGPGAELRRAAALARLDEPSAARAADALAAAGILRPGRPPEFLHPILRDVVYGELERGERAAAHADAARLLLEAGEDPERIAPQLIAGEPSGLGWAVETLRAAARAAIVRGAPDVAVTYLERALKEPPAPADQPELLLELGIAQAHARRPEAPARLAEAMDAARDSRSHALAALELGRALFYAQEPARAVEVLGRGLDARPPADLAVPLETELALIGYTGLTGRRLVADRIADLRERQHELDPETHRALLGALSIELTVLDGNAAEATALAERALGPDGARAAESPVLICALGVLGACDRVELGERLAGEAIGEARRRGLLQQLGHALAVRAELRYRRGALIDADADARRAIEGGADIAFAYGIPYGLAILGYTLIDRGELDEAAALIDRDGIPGDDGDTGFSQYLRFARARLHVAIGRVEEGLDELLAVGRWERDYGIRYPCWLPWRSEAAVACHALGRRERAAAMARECVDAARAFGARTPLGVALRTLGVVSGRPEPLREACDVLDGSGAQLEHARALAELGIALRDAEPLRRAHDLAQRCGASALERRVHEALIVTGARPRRAPAGALTPAERRVAAMAAEGLTNREVAQTLFLSPKTVEMHLGRVYRKLGIASRLRLRDALRD